MSKKERNVVKDDKEYIKQKINEYYFILITDLDRHPERYRWYTVASIAHILFFFCHSVHRQSPYQHPLQDKTQGPHSS